MTVMDKHRKQDIPVGSIFDLVDASPFDRGVRVLVAASGGADSMALLSILHRLSRDRSEGGEFELAVGHFDHRLRETSSVDRRRVEVMAASLGIQFYCGEGDIRSRAQAHGETIEEAARRLRYRYLFKLAADIDADLIATGHTRDDQIETVMMRVLRGTGVRGLVGIPARRGKVIRPILGLTRKQTVAYCRDNHIAYVEDPANQDRRFTRNWIRHELLPVIEENFPNVGDNLLRLSRNAADAVRRVRKVTSPLVHRYLTREPGGEWTLDLSDISGLDHNHKYVLFGDLLTEHLGRDPGFSRDHFEKLARLSGPAAVSGQKLSLPGLTIRREYDKLVFDLEGKTHPAAPGFPDATVLPVPGRVTFGNLCITSTIVPAAEYEAKKYRSTEPPLFETNSNWVRGVAYFDLGAVETPLSIRTPRPGDRIRPFGMPGHKKISDVFTDKKIPLRRRGQAIVISDKKEILWLVGITTSESTRVSRASTKILKITVFPE